MNSKILLAVLAVAMLMASGCVSVIKTPGENITYEESVATEIGIPAGLEEADEPEAGSALPTKTVVEGEKVSFPNLKAVDPDGDPITYTFTKPLDSKGEWQTKKGDAGQYKVLITASDGTSKVSQEVLIVVKSLNKIPVLGGLEDIAVEEGQTVSLSPAATDADGDDVKLSFSGWMDSASKETSYGDAGVHEVTVTADDGKDSVSKTIKVTVKKVNRAPVLDAFDDVQVTEGDSISVKASAADADGDDVVIKFSEPLDSNGEWKTEVGDAGKYKVKVTASDGASEAVESFYLTVVSANKAPVLSGINDITAKEGDLITLSITAADPEGDDVAISFSQPFDAEGKWQTGYEDAGSYEVVATASDGNSESKQSFKVTVQDYNRAPAFSEGAFE